MTSSYRLWKNSSACDADCCVRGYDIELWDARFGRPTVSTVRPMFEIIEPPPDDIDDVPEEGVFRFDPRKVDSMARHLAAVGDRPPIIL